MSQNLYGLMAGFESGEDLLEAVRVAQQAGLGGLDAYSPMPVEGLAEALGHDDNTMAKICFFGGLAGAAGAYGLQWWVSVEAYPLNIGGRPLHSWPSFIPVTFEATVLCASLALLVGFLLLNQLPQLYHGTFQSDSFARASRDRFFLCVEAEKTGWQIEEIRSFLRGLRPQEIIELER